MTKFGKFVSGALGAATILLALPANAEAPAADAFTMERALSYPFIGELEAARTGDVVAFVRVFKGARNIWIAEGPDFKPRQVTSYTEDDGQELTQLTLSPAGDRLVYVRGGDHDANWEAKLPPDPDSSSTAPEVAIWSAPLSGGKPEKIVDGDAPALSQQGELAYIKDGAVWSLSLTKKRAKPARLFFDRGNPSELKWSPDGTKLAFVSGRDGDHSFIGVFDLASKKISYIAPSTNRDFYPVWSPDGGRIAFVRAPGIGGAPEPILKETPNPFSIWVGDVATGAADKVWKSPATLRGSYPETAGQANLHWAAGDNLVFLADVDNWPHLYAVPAKGGEAVLLTPGDYMVEHVAQSRDGASMIFDANTGAAKDDGDRRHIFSVNVNGGEPVALTSGLGLEWSPVVAGDNAVLFINAGVGAPPSVSTIALDGSGRRAIGVPGAADDFPEKEFVTPKAVTFTAADGLTIHGQLFEKPDGKTNKPGIIFVHGGPPRQMLLGWHYMDYYSNAYAVNQYLANHGYVVLSVNYRLGIGYGHDFHHPPHAGPAGAAEYQDVVAGAKFLQKQESVDASKIGVWGGSYGGYLTAMGLARNSEIFKAGVDLHGVHDWSRFLSVWFGNRAERYEKGDVDEALKVSFQSSPVADVKTWKSPVLLIHGDDDRNVNFVQTIDLARRLDKQGVRYEEMVLPNEIHGFLRWRSWLDVDKATAAYFKKELPPAE